MKKVTKWEKTKLIIAFILILISLVIIIQLGWNSLDQYRNCKKQIKEEAEAVVKLFIAMREFIAEKQDLINRDSHGNYEFKGLNPATVGRGVGEIYKSTTNYSIKQTRIKYRNSKNSPDLFEIEALRKFEKNKDLKEISEITKLEGKRVFRYMVPLYISEPCLQCHGEPKSEIDVAGYKKEGYRIGELGGGF